MGSQNPSSSRLSHKMSQQRLIDNFESHIPHGRNGMHVIACATCTSIWHADTPFWKVSTDTRVSPLSTTDMKGLCGPNRCRCHMFRSARSYLLSSVSMARLRFTWRFTGNEPSTRTSYFIRIVTRDYLATFPKRLPSYETCTAHYQTSATVPNLIRSQPFEAIVLFSACQCYQHMYLRRTAPVSFERPCEVVRYCMYIPHPGPVSPV